MKRYSLFTRTLDNYNWIHVEGCGAYRMSVAKRVFTPQLRRGAMSPNTEWSIRRVITLDKDRITLDFEGNYETLTTKK